MTRQAKYQARMKSEGRCRLCGKPLFNKTYCYKCAVKAREGQHRRNGAVRRNDAPSYHPEGGKRCVLAKTMMTLAAP